VDTVHSHFLFQLQGLGDQPDDLIEMEGLGDHQIDPFSLIFSRLSSIPIR